MVSVLPFLLLLWFQLSFFCCGFCFVVVFVFVVVIVVAVVIVGFFFAVLYNNQIDNHIYLDMISQ